MEVNEDRWFRGVRLSPERQRVQEAMASMDEGLGPRAYRCLLQLADSEQPSAADVAWLTDGVEPVPIARIGGDGRCVLTAHGRLLAAAADRGDMEAMLALTTMPALLGEAG